MRVGLSVREGDRLYSALLPTTTDAGGARYTELVDFLRSNNAKWYDAERGIADKVGVNDTLIGGLERPVLADREGGRRGYEESNVDSQPHAITRPVPATRETK